MRSQLVGMIVQFLLLAAATPANLSIPTFIASRMVLQRERPTLWGNANPLAMVSVFVDGTAIATTFSASNGRWVLSMPSQQAGGGHTITITSAGHSIDLTDIGFGDVFLCTGQSNM